MVSLKASISPLMPSNAEAPAEDRPLPWELLAGVDKRDSLSTAESLHLPLPDEMMDAGAEKDAGVEALAEALAKGGIEDEIELLEKKAVVEAEGEGEGNAGGEVAGGDEVGGNSVLELTCISFALSFAVLAKE